MTITAPAGVLAQMQSLSSAEDLFTFLLLPYDAAVLNRARLHIMKRMGDYLEEARLDTLGEDDVFLAARRALKRAHADFRDSSPREQKSIKLFRQKPKNFLPIETLRVDPR